MKETLGKERETPREKARQNESKGWGRREADSETHSKRETGEKSLS